MLSSNTDDFGILDRGLIAWPLFLEREWRSRRPSALSDRLAPILRPYSSHRPTDDLIVRPSGLLVLDDDIASSYFLAVAQEEMQTK